MDKQFEILNKEIVYQGFFRVKNTVLNTPCLAVDGALK